VVPFLVQVPENQKTYVTPKKLCTTSENIVNRQEGIIENFRRAVDLLFIFCIP
jgi:hypothetical protein